jgi:hypothetical protein
VHPLHAAQVLVRVVYLGQSGDGQRKAGARGEQQSNAAILKKKRIHARAKQIAAHRPPPTYS